MALAPKTKRCNQTEERHYFDLPHGKDYITVTCRCGKKTDGFSTSLYRVDITHVVTYKRKRMLRF